MSVEAMASVWKMELPHGEKFVLVAMADHADKNGRGMYPSVDRIAHKTGYNERQVRRLIDALVNRGAIIYRGIHPETRTRIYDLVPDTDLQTDAFDTRNHCGSPDKMSAPISETTGQNVRSEPSTPDKMSTMTGQNVHSDRQSDRTFATIRPDIYDNQTGHLRQSRNKDARGTILKPSVNHQEENTPFPPKVEAKAKPQASPVRDREKRGIELLAAYRSIRFPGLAAYSVTEWKSYRPILLALVDDGRTPEQMQAATKAAIAKFSAIGMVNPNSVGRGFDSLLEISTPSREIPKEGKVLPEADVPPCPNDHRERIWAAAKKVADEDYRDNRLGHFPTHDDIRVRARRLWVAEYRRNNPATAEGERKAERDRAANNRVVTAQTVKASGFDQVAGVMH